AQASVKSPIFPNPCRECNCSRAYRASHASSLVSQSENDHILWSPGSAWAAQNEPGGGGISFVPRGFLPPDCFSIWIQALVSRSQRITNPRELPIRLAAGVQMALLPTRISL